MADIWLRQLFSPLFSYFCLNFIFVLCEKLTKLITVFELSLDNSPNAKPPISLEPQKQTVVRVTCQLAFWARL